MFFFFSHSFLHTTTCTKHSYHNNITIKILNRINSFSPPPYKDQMATTLHTCFHEFFTLFLYITTTNNTLHQTNPFFQHITRTRPTCNTRPMHQHTYFHIFHSFLQPTTYTTHPQHTKRMKPYLLPLVFSLE